MLANLKTLIDWTLLSKFIFTSPIRTKTHVMLAFTTVRFHHKTTIVPTQQSAKTFLKAHVGNLRNLPRPQPVIDNLQQSLSIKLVDT